MIKTLFVIALSLLPLSANAFGLECGTFEAVGLLRFEQDRPVLVLNEGSSSEMQVEFQNRGDLLPSDSGIAIQARFEISKPCRLRCQAELKKLVRVLEPFENLPIYSLDSAGLKKKKACKAP